MVVHSQAAFAERLREVLLGGAPSFGCRINQNLAYARELILRDADLVGGHPPLYHRPRLGSAQLEQRPVILGRNQLPGAPHQM